jgi:predicted adenine nucleotide alpha hydrolase (AANH) superfamily ATPase
LRENYQRGTDAVLAELDGRRPTLLLQVCCGPCGSYVLEYLTKYFAVSVLYYNPNTQPESEYEKRGAWLRRVLEHYPEVKLLDCAYDGAAFDDIAHGLEREPEGGARCTRCFELRLRETARRAAEGDFEWFCTTLSVSPHKDAERLNAIGSRLAAEYGVRWLPSDFKKRGGYQRSVELAREWGLYRQEYCGCLFSLEQSKK